jgi:protein-tyrosine kinase
MSTPFARHDAMNDTQPLDKQESVVALARRAEGGTMMRVAEPQALTPRRLEERRLIHRDESVRVHADAFRELRTRLLALSNGATFVTLVAPIDHGCGGSFVARNLAAAFAFDETKTALLIDCDARHPSQHRALDVDAGVRGGLMDYIADPSVEIERIVHGTGIPRLHLIPNGTSREATAESFTSLRMRTLIDSLRGHGDEERYVILDGPAVKGSPDARILSDLADRVVLVAGYGMVSPGAIEKAAASFPQDKIAGIVFNNGP